MPFFYNVAVKSEAHFGTDEPKLFRPMAHTSEQALRMVLSHIWAVSPAVEMAEISTTTKQEKQVGGYDDPLVMMQMMTQSGTMGT